MLTSVLPSSLLMSSRGARFSRLALDCGKKEETQMDVMPLVLGDERKIGCPKSPMREREGEAWSEDECVSSSGSREGNVGKQRVARHRGCMGLVTKSLNSWRIGSWQRWLWVATWPRTCCARKCMRPGSRCGYREACCHGMSPLLSPWTGRDC